MTPSVTQSIGLYQGAQIKLYNGNVHRRLGPGTLQVPPASSGDWPGTHSSTQPLMDRSNKMPGPRLGHSTLSLRLLARFSTVV